MFCQEWEINELGSSPMLNNNLLPSSWCCPTPSHPTQHYLKSWSYSSPCYLKGDLLNIVLRIDLVFFFVSLPSTNPGRQPQHLAPQCKLCKYYIPSLSGTQAPVSRYPPLSLQLHLGSSPVLQPTLSSSSHSPKNIIR